MMEDGGRGEGVRRLSMARQGWKAVMAAAALASACGGSAQPGNPGTGDECASCHLAKGSYTGAIDTEGHGPQDRAYRGVGAHVAHMLGGPLSIPLDCVECHTVPALFDQAGHVDSPLPAEVTFAEFQDGAHASTGGANPEVVLPDPAQPYDDQAEVRCRNVYCHGATLTGGTATEPSWNRPGSSFTKCDSCHGYAPPVPHPQSKQCADCHVATFSGGELVPSMHIDGDFHLKPLACNACHGNPDGDPSKDPDVAPPLDTHGKFATTEVTVGAHQAHLAATAIAPAFACSECHVVPASQDSPGHIDDVVATVTFGTLATTGAAAPSWDRTTATCSGVYCHGATLGGGTLKAPLWTKVDGTQGACGDCHGLPPPSPHPQNQQCSACHAETAAPDGTIADVTKHVNGTVEATGTACNTCHGSTDSNAPPKDTHGNSATAEVTVGAHQSHLKASALSGPVACNDCHVVPAVVDAPGHIDQETATVTFANLATTDGAQPSWDRAKAQCSQVYCHGATLGGGTLKTPTWTKVDGSQVVCGSCHGLPPPLPHFERTDCATCHTETVTPEMTISDPEKHIDGKIEVTLPASCTACHGTPGVNAGPPVDTHGGSDTTLVTVGAHQSHLQSPLSNPVACGACHVVPATAEDPGHIDQETATVTFSGLAKSDGALPSWDAASATCAGAYCHGATLGGGVLKVPLWTKVDGTQAKCGSCHGVPPPAPHVQSDHCEACHAETAGAGQVVAHTEKHIDGKVEVSGNAQCNACHGSADNNAPPLDTHGDSATNLVTVGAHQSHLNESPIRVAVPCNECHKVPATVGDPDHIDGPTATLTFGSIARAGGLNPAWSEGDAKCSGTWCHGAKLTGGVLLTPTWTKVDGTQAKCGSCHGVPPPAPHPDKTDCGTCHAATVNPDGSFKDKSKHIDGTVQASVSCNSCHGNATNAAPPVDTHGDSATSLVTVGAHQPHLLASSSLTAPVACAECHVVPSSVGDPGHIDNPTATVTFGTLAKTGGLSPAWSHGAASCTNVYCHGASIAGGTNKTPVWTTVNNSQDACGTCHGNPPGGSHPANAYCGYCHVPTASVAGGIQDKTTHIDGTLQVKGQACNSCHGSATNNAPPVDTAGNSATSAKGVGAHQQHLQASLMTLSNPFACTDCHVVPGSVGAAGHLDGTPGAELTWGTLAKTGASNPTYNSAGNPPTCSNTYCHGRTLTGGSNKTPQWTTVNGSQDACGTCHGTPPGSGEHGKHSGYACGRCHYGVASTSTPNAITGKALHPDGAITVGLSSGGTWNSGAKTCDPSCHGLLSWY
jgi:predicted CxxxxCH...CXXCH cytochrome family protein